jgi:hypothetical protein
MSSKFMNHTSRNRFVRGIALALFILIVEICGGVSGQIYNWTTSAMLQQGKPARRWHPTRIPTGTVFVGDQSCAECHKDKAATQLQSSMGLAMESIKDSKVLTANPKMTFRIGPYAYEIKRDGDRSVYTVTDGKETISLPILYAFGQGKAGQTYVLQYDGAYFESFVSYYNEIKGLDFTIGTARTAPGSLVAAVGRRLTKNETVSCFGCHSTGAISGTQFQPEKLTPGIRCEICHGPGGDHVAAGKAGGPSAQMIFNPARLSGDELTQDFCASCHRGNGEFAMLKSMEENNVRFQPYRIFQSKCYSDDRRISCVACHDPHTPIQQDAAYYDAKCLACHTASGKAKPAALKQDRQESAPGCKVAAKNCASCHMPKVEPPGAHFKFTDHYIRIAKPNEAYQN